MFNYKLSYYGSVFLLLKLVIEVLSFYSLGLKVSLARTYFRPSNNTYLEDDGSTSEKNDFACFVGRHQYVSVD